LQFRAAVEFAVRCVSDAAHRRIDVSGDRACDYRQSAELPQPHMPLIWQHCMPRTQDGQVDGLHAPLEEPLPELLDEDDELDVLPSSPPSSPGEVSSAASLVSSPLLVPLLELRP
jgi:hypothetical protein